MIKFSDYELVREGELVYTINANNVEFNVRGVYVVIFSTMISSFGDVSYFL